MARVYLEGGAYDGGGDPIDPPPSSGGGAASAAANIALITASGGLTGIESMLLIPIYDPDRKTFFFATFDYENFDTETDCEYQYRIEDVIEGRKITISRIRIVYRDLGIVKVKAEIRVAPEDESISSEIIIGSIKADKKLHTAYFDILTTGERPQLILTRKKDDGPLSIVSATMIPTVENCEQL